VGAGHAHALYRPGTSPLHRIAPECKIAATLLFVLAVVATPREAIWAFALHAALVIGAGRIGDLPLTVMARRLVIEVPFVAFAFLLPFIAGGPRIDVGPLSLSESGLWGGWNILAKATIGLLATVVLASTTDLPGLVRGMERLRVPRVFTAVAGFMIRYADVITGELRRMSVARRSRGHDPRWLWQARAIASSAGALFVRCFERGERVHLAMLSRGYTGTLPALDKHRTPPAEWLTLALPVVAAGVATAAWVA